LTIGSTYSAVLNKVVIQKRLAASVLFYLVLEGKQPSAGGSHLSCPFCSGYAIGRMYVASANLDTCECLACGARWEEERGSGNYVGRAPKSSVLAPRND
jgi:hypothetical protein